MPDPRKIQFQPNSQPEPVTIKGQQALDEHRNNPYSQVINLVFLKQNKRYPNLNNPQDLAKYRRMQNAAKVFHGTNKKMPTSDDLERSMHYTPHVSSRQGMDYFVPNTNIDELAKQSKEQSMQQFGALAYNKSSGSNSGSGVENQIRTGRENQTEDGEDVNDFSNLTEIDLPENFGSEPESGSSKSRSVLAPSENFEPEERLRFPQNSGQKGAVSSGVSSVGEKVQSPATSAAVSGAAEAGKAMEAGKQTAAAAKTVESVGQVASGLQKAENLTGGSAVDPLAAVDVKGVTDTAKSVFSGDLVGAAKNFGITLIVSGFKLCVNWEFILFTAGLSIIGALLLAPLAVFWFFTDHFGPYEKICLIIALVLDGVLVFLEMVFLVAMLGYMCGWVSGWAGWFASFFSSTANSAYEFCNSLPFKSFLP